MAAKKSESVNIRKYKGKRELNIGIFLFVIVLFYLIVTLVLYLSEDTPSVYEVREGSIVKDTSYTGLIIRDEQDIKSEGSGYIYYYFNDNSKIKAGKCICVGTVQAGDRIFRQCESFNIGELGSADLDHAQDRKF